MFRSVPGVSLETKPAGEVLCVVSAEPIGKHSSCVGQGFGSVLGLHEGSTLVEMYCPASRRGPSATGVRRMKSRIKTTFKFLLWSVIIVGLLGLEGNSLVVAEGSWTTPTDLSLAGQHAYDPQIASSADGTKLTATWYRYDGSNWIVQAATSTDSGTTWTTHDLSAALQNAVDPQIVSSADGTKLAATWIRYDGSNYIVQAASSTDSGATWSTAIDLSAASSDASFTQIVSSADGTRLAATWSRIDGSNYIVQAASSTNSGATWSTAIDLSAASSAVPFPQIVSSADGTKLTATWAWDDGSNYIVQTSSLRSVSGSRRISHHHVNFDSTGGTCAEHSTAWTVRFRGSYTLPTGCTRDGHVFLGWTRDPELTAPENLLTRTISRSANLTAVWGELPTAPSVVHVLANFLCRQNCDSALIVWPSSSAAGDTSVIIIDGSEATCTGSGEASNLRWCWINALTPKSAHTASVSWRNQYGPGPTTSAAFTLN